MIYSLVIKGYVKWVDKTRERFYSLSKYFLKHVKKWFLPLYLTNNEINVDGSFNFVAQNFFMSWVTLPMQRILIACLSRFKTSNFQSSCWKSMTMVLWKVLSPFKLGLLKIFLGWAYFSVIKLWQTVTSLTLSV